MATITPFDPSEMTDTQKDEILKKSDSRNGALMILGIKVYEMMHNFDDIPTYFDHPSNVDIYYSKGYRDALLRVYQEIDLSINVLIPKEDK